MLDAFKKHLSSLVDSGQSSVVSRHMQGNTQYSMPSQNATAGKAIPNTQYPFDKKFLLAVSGGLDSIVMAELFRRAGCNYSIAHCNFQLRGKESEEDLKFVKKLGIQTQAPFFYVRFETEQFCLENKISVQMGARELRYKWFEEVRQQNKLDYIVTAHHADDAIETFFINLLRGTGISGLHGIAEKNDAVIRPMLHFYRKEIEGFAKENKLKWREDSSNITDKYERNKIRHYLLPLLEEVNPKAKESIRATIENLGRTELILNKALDSITTKYIRTKDGRTFIHFNFFKELVPAPDYLYEVIKKFGFNYEQCKQIAESAKGQPGKMFWSDLYRIVIDRETLIIEPRMPDEENRVYEVGKELEELLTNTYTCLFRTRKKPKNFVIPENPDTAAIDLDKLKFPLKIRKWEKGDRFYPLGMKNPKKISDFLIDNKVSMPDKEQICVLISNGKIAWLMGYRLDERFKITEATKNVYLCRLKNHPSMNEAHRHLLIDKEIISNLHFPKEEVLTSAELKLKREYELERASSLGNDKVKIKILFEDSEGMKQVETTVWAVTKDSIVLKHGATIPIKRIHEIKI